MIIGEFNRHVGILGEQKADEGGNIVLSWMDKYNFILFNNVVNCKGLYILQVKDFKSVIDYALVNTAI